MAPTRYKACLRCGSGDMNLMQEAEGDEWVCAQCGDRPVHVTEDVRTERPQGAHQLRPMKKGWGNK